jgi:protein TonB
MGLAGDVTLDALIDTDGNVMDVKTLSGPALLQQAARDAVRLWKYAPARLDGRPVPMHLTVTVKFSSR